MPSASTQRALRGACEGAGLGLAVAIVRAGMRFIQEGAPADFGPHVPAFALYVGVHVIVTAYVVSVGRFIADAIGGALVGTALLAIGGAAIAAVLPPESPGTSTIVLVGAGVGALVGAPAGAGIQRAVFKRLSTKNGSSTSRKEDE